MTVYIVTKTNVETNTTVIVDAFSSKNVAFEETEKLNGQHNGWVYKTETYPVY